MTEFIADLIALDGEDFDSSNIDTLAYDAEGNRLFVEFQNGSTYVYDGVAESTYDMMVGDDSVGGFFNTHISGRYTSHKDNWWVSERKNEVEQAEADSPVEINPINSDMKFGTISGITSIEAHLNKQTYGVKWTNGTLTFEPVYQALSEADALAQFASAVESVMPGTKTRILAVTHYFD